MNKRTFPQITQITQIPQIAQIKKDCRCRSGKTQTKPQAIENAHYEVGTMCLPGFFPVLTKFLHSSIWVI